jgi:Protein of unknown function (DUF3592)
MMVIAVLLAIVGLVCVCWAADSLCWLRSMRTVPDVAGTVVGRDRRHTGRDSWTYPVVEFTTRDGTAITCTFQQLSRPRIGRTVRIVYDPSRQFDGRGRSTSGLALVSKPPLIYSVWLLLWFWLLAAFGLALLALCIAVLADTSA